MVDKWPVQNLARAIATNLWSLRLPEELEAEKEERAFQEWVGKNIRECLTASYPSRFRVRIETGEGGVAPVRAFGTSFWPDVSVESTDGERLVAIEVKCLAQAGLPARITQALGQALMYKQIYAQSMVVFVPLRELKMPPPPFFENVSDHGIEVAIVGGIISSRGMVDAP